MQGGENAVAVRLFKVRMQVMENFDAHQILNGDNFNFIYYINVMKMTVSSNAEQVD